MKKLHKKYNVQFVWIDFNKKALYTSDCIPWKAYIDDINLSIEMSEAKREAEILKSMQEKEAFQTLVESHGISIRKVHRLYSESDMYDTHTVQEFFLYLVSNKIK